jgi:hypothetical protein
MLLPYRAGVVPYVAVTDEYLAIVVFVEVDEGRVGEEGCGEEGEEEVEGLHLVFGRRGVMAVLASGFWDLARGSDDDWLPGHKVQVVPRCLSNS